MNGYVTVFRSADASAGTDASRAQAALTGSGIEALLCDDKEEGVPAGCWEVRVPEADAARAETLLAERTPLDAAEDASPALDMVAVFQGQSAEAEMEALAVKGLLEANEIPAVLVGSSPLPAFAFEVQVPAGRAAEAAKLIEEARAAAQAEEAAAASTPEPADASAPPPLNMVTVFEGQSADAETEAMAVKGLLDESEIPALLVSSSTLPSLSFEVRVPEERAEEARKLIADARTAAATAQPDEAAEETALDTSAALDLVAVFESQRADAEMEALAVQKLLEASGIPAVLSGSSPLPSLPFSVQVPRERVDEALARIAEAREAGPEGAEEAERAGE